jgi:GntR family transcriptional regulator/MocR family aminotransferase
MSGSIRSKWHERKNQFEDNFQSNPSSSPMDPTRLTLPIDLHIPVGRGATAALHGQLREAILSGRLATGCRLPPTRNLAQALGVARSTVVLAFDRLVAEGYASVRQGDGTFVRSLRRSPERAPQDPAGARVAVAAAPAKPRFDLRVGSPDISSFPFDVWRRMASKAWRASTGPSGDDVDPAGLAPLRELIVQQASSSRAVACSAADVVVTAGAQQAFDLLARTLVQPGTCVAVEDPGYPPMRMAFAAAGARIVGVPVDAQGMVVDALPEDAKVICVTPSHQMPLGVTLAPDRRLALLEFAGRHDATLVEDDYDSEYRYDGRPLDALQILAPERVCYVGTFSKTMFPALRLGYAILPEPIRSRLLALRRLTDGFGAPAPQLALANFIGDGHFDRHVRRMRRVYADRRARLLTGLGVALRDRIQVLPSTAGLHFSFRLPASTDWGPWMARAAALDIGLDRCARFALRDAGDDACVIGFGMLRDEQVAAVVERLSKVFA